MCRRSVTYKPLKTLAVLGATAFFLVACGGGGGNGKPDPTPPENGEQQMRITPLREYGSIAYGIRAAAGSEGGRSTQAIITTTSTGTSRSAARDTALAKCRTGCGTESACRSSCREVLRFRNACGASASGGGSDAGYLFDGVGWGASESVAERNATAACNRAASTKEGASGNESCKIIDDVGNAFCAKAGSATPSGEASTIAAASYWTPGSTPTPTSGNSYGSLAFSMSSSSWGTAGNARSNSQSSARNAALAMCRQRASSRSSSPDCQEFLWFRNACGSSAISQDNSRIGAGWGESESEAGSKAIAACHTAGGQGCQVQTSSAGRPGTFCAKSGSATPTGQASRIPARPTSSTREEPEPDYGAIYHGKSTGGRWAWGAANRTTPSAALAAARTRCNGYLGETCRRVSFSFGPNRCGALAVSRNADFYGHASAGTSQAARNSATDSCENNATGNSRGTCHIPTTSGGDPAVLCVGTAR